MLTRLTQILAHAAGFYQLNGNPDYAARLANVLKRLALIVSITQNHTEPDKLAETSFRG